MDDLTAGPETSRERGSRRFRFRLGTALITVLVIGIPLGMVARSYREAHRREAVHAELNFQERLTGQVLDKMTEDLNRNNNAWRSFSRGLSSTYKHWEATMTCSTQAFHPAIELTISGECGDLDLKAIRIESNGGALDAQVIDRLTATYREKGWAFEVIPNGAIADP